MPSTRISRRALIRSSAAGAVVVAAGGVLPRQGRPGGADGSIGIGVIGCGAAGRQHLAGIAGRLAEPGSPARAAAICDVSGSSIRSAREVFSGPAFSNYVELLGRGDVDAVIIATPVHLHARMALAAMRAGKDVYIEAPVTLTFQEAREVALAAARYHRIVQVGLGTVPDDRWRGAREMIRSGEIGKLVWSQSGCCRKPAAGEAAGGATEGASAGSGSRHPWEAASPPRWQPCRDFAEEGAAGGLFRQLAHLHIALGSGFPSRVTAYGPISGREQPDLPDCLSLNIEYPGGHTVVLVSSVAYSQCVPNIIRGRDATLFLTDTGIEVRPAPGSSCKARRTVIASSPRRTPADEFVECVRRRRRPEFDADAACQVMAALRMGIESWRSRTSVSFEYAMRQAALG